MTETRKRINYTVACVSEFAKRYGISPKEAFQFLYEYKAIEFLMGEFCYEQQKQILFGFLESLLVELEYKEATNQYSFHTEKALQLLKKVGVSYE